MASWVQNSKTTQARAVQACNHSTPEVEAVVSPASCLKKQKNKLGRRGGKRVKTGRTELREIWIDTRKRGRAGKEEGEDREIRRHTGTNVDWVVNSEVYKHSLYHPVLLKIRSRWDTIWCKCRKNTGWEWTTPTPWEESKGPELGVHSSGPLWSRNRRQGVQQKAQ